MAIHSWSKKQVNLFNRLLIANLDITQRLRNHLSSFLLPNIHHVLKHFSGENNSNTGSVSRH